LIDTERLLLRPPRAGDIPALIRYYKENREHLTPWEPAWPEGFLTERFWQSQLAQIEEQARAGTALRLVVLKRADRRKLIGSINFTAIQRGALLACVLGYSLAEKEQGNGYMTEALRAAIDHVFRQLALHRVMANYIPRNVRSGRLLGRLGFVIEGYARDYMLVNGRWEDHVLTALINPAPA
jgi:[ribosomal protein S5]-alanine N-acetyltransferase